MKIRGVFLLWVLLLAVFALIVPAEAQKIEEDYKKAMPEIPLLEKKAFEALSREYSDLPLGAHKKNLKHVLRLPSDWEKDPEIGQQPVALNNKIFTEIARFYGPFVEGFRSHLKIELMEMEFSFSAEQLLLKHLLSFNYTMQGFKVIEKSRAEALYVIIDKDQEYAVRSVMIVNGPYALLLSYYLPVELWDTGKTLQATVVNSLQMPNKEDGFVEPMLPYEFLDIAKAEFPRSWELRAQTFRSLDRLDISLLNIASRTTNDDYARTIKLLEGRVNLRLVSLFSTNSLDDEIALIKKEVSEGGMILGEKNEVPVDLSYNDNFEFATTEIFKATEKNNINTEYEFWLATMAYGEYYYFATLLTPARSEDYFLWARNTETFKAILASFSPMIKQ